ncbi:MAG TPA: 30S ribosomal protein S20 [Bacilli bacterium]|jgi:small subunit ribosomal protein S20|nr:30S ribosomal protein S20 [Bacilli bacterium]HOR52840.1 30S ribosomal protein S20 [Bacilli bacterium]HPL58784.1 30S ribosomal protein S20 [Bacilli bacterium]
MANIKQQAKRNITNEKRRLRNVSLKSSVRTAIKKVELAISNDNYAEALELYKVAAKRLDTAQGKGVYHKNSVARKKSHLCKAINKIAPK